MIWLTADTHFGHTNILKYCGRPFSSIEEMDETLINNWNNKVNQDDTVYHLGDFSFKDPGVYKKTFKWENNTNIRQS
jgi:calcineurin-like phosphoesterase family protein